VNTPEELARSPDQGIVPFGPTGQHWGTGLEEGA
jgi:hypothetical protein